MGQTTASQSLVSKTSITNKTKNSKRRKKNDEDTEDEDERVQCIDRTNNKSNKGNSNQMKSQPKNTKNNCINTNEIELVVKKKLITTTTTRPLSPQNQQIHQNKTSENSEISINPDIKINNKIKPIDAEDENSIRNIDSVDPINNDSEKSNELNDNGNNIQESNINADLNDASSNSNINSNINVNNNKSNSINTNISEKITIKKEQIEYEFRLRPKKKQFRLSKRSFSFRKNKKKQKSRQKSCDDSFGGFEENYQSNFSCLSCFPFCNICCVSTEDENGDQVQKCLIFSFRTPVNLHKNKKQVYNNTSRHSATNISDEEMASFNNIVSMKSTAKPTQSTIGKKGSCNDSSETINNFRAQHLENNFRLSFISSLFNTLCCFCNRNGQFFPYVNSRKQNNQENNNNYLENGDYENDENIGKSWSCFIRSNQNRYENGTNQLNKKLSENSKSNLKVLGRKKTNGAYETNSKNFKENASDEFINPPPITCIRVLRPSNDLSSVRFDSHFNIIQSSTNSSRANLNEPDENEDITAENEKR